MPFQRNGDFVLSFHIALEQGVAEAVSLLVSHVESLHEDAVSCYPALVNESPKRAFELALNNLGAAYRNQPFRFPAQNGSAEKFPAQYAVFKIAAEALGIAS